MSVPIVRIAARGDGVAADGRHVPLTAPGDQLQEDGTVLAGPHHQMPPCRHFPRCGGCQLQHVDDTSYATFLGERITAALASQGLSADELRPPHLSPPRSRRRAALRAERIGRRVVLGFNEASSHRIVDMRECHILRPELFALVAPLRALLAGLLRERRQATIRMTLADQGVDLALEGVEVVGLTASETLTEFAQDRALARLSVDEGFGAETRWEPEPTTVTLGGVAVPLPPAAFLQATADGEAALTAGVLAVIGDASQVVDLFCGLGTLSLPAARGRAVLAVEGSRDAVLALKGAAARAGLRLAAEHRDLFRRPLTDAELARFSGIILDPPRAGAKEQMPALARTPAGSIGYVSCNPATFARDARVLIDAGWRLAWVRPIGQFRWSTHVELVAQFLRN
jgi:23S rRNA (uracil1939-C5)-methyltransferase